MTNQSMQQARAEIAALLIEAYRDGQGVHSETMIGGAAALAGEFGLRAIEPNLPEQGWVVGDKINGLLFENEEQGEATLWTIIRVGAERAGAPAEELPDPVDVVARVAAKIGGSPFPPLTVPERHYPHEWSPNACPRLRRAIEIIADARNLSSVDRAMAIAFAIAFLIAQIKDVLPPVIAATLALEIMIGVSRMAPMKEPITV